MTLIMAVIPELNSGQALTNPPAGGLSLSFEFFIILNTKYKIHNT